MIYSINIKYIHHATTPTTSHQPLVFFLILLGRHQQSVLKQRVEHAKHHDDATDDGHERRQKPVQRHGILPQRQYHRVKVKRKLG
jgi:hypothetical protein